MTGSVPDPCAGKVPGLVDDPNNPKSVGVGKLESIDSSLQAVQKDTAKLDSIDSKLTSIDAGLKSGFWSTVKILKSIDNKLRS